MTSWTTRTLGEVATVGAGNSAPQDEALFASGSVPFFRTSDVGRIRFGDIDTATDLLNERGANGLRRFASGTILFPKSGASTFLNHRVMMQVDGCVSSHLATIAARRELAEPRFLLYFLATVQAQDLVQNHAYPSLNLPLIAGIEVPLPPLPEQRRVVAILDEAFEAIATAKVNTENNLRNIRALLDFTRRDVFASLAREHEPATMGQCCTFENGDRGKNYPGKEHRVAHGVPFVNAGHLTEDGLDFSQMDYISHERFELLGNGKIRPWDVLFCLRGSLGKFACVGDLGRGAIASSLVILRPGPGLTIGYLLEFLASTQCAEQIERHKGGAAQPNLGAQDLKRFELPLPPIHVQEATATRLASLRAAVSDAKALLLTKLAALHELKKSLLHQAFTGQLTAKSTDQQLEAVA